MNSCYCGSSVGRPVIDMPKRAGSWPSLTIHGPLWGGENAGRKNSPDRQRWGPIQKKRERPISTRAQGFYGHGYTDLHDGRRSDPTFYRDKKKVSEEKKMCSRDERRWADKCGINDAYSQQLFNRLAVRRGGGEREKTWDRMFTATDKTKP